MKILVILGSPFTFWDVNEQDSSNPLFINLFHLVSFVPFQAKFNLWNVYNLFTGANKQSYVDTFLDRGVNAFEFVENLAHSIESKANSWFLN